MLVRTRQTGIKVQTTPGVEESLAAANFSGNLYDQSFTYTPGEFERAVQRATLTPLQTVKGSRLLKVNRKQELVGGGIATQPNWHTDLMACGYAATQMKVAAIGSLANATQFKPGLRIGNNATEGSATKTGVLARVSGGKIWYVPGTGSFTSGDTVYGYPASGLQPSGTLSGSPTNGGYRLAPQSETDAVTPTIVTMELRDGSQRHSLIDGRGTGSISLKMNEPMMLSSEITGCPVFDTDTFTPRSLGYMANVPAVGTTPSVCKGIAFTVGGVTPVLTMLDIDLGNTVTPRGTMANNDAALSGYKGVRVTGRKVTARIDPEWAIAEKDYVNALTKGDTFELIAEVGVSSNANGLLLVHAPAVQVTGDITPGDRDGITTVEPNLLFTGSGDDELVLYHCFE